jgi:U3 small nucleolar ribonucleoprotein protein IMP4
MAMRRNVRLRREYLYRKSLEGKEKAIYERKLKVKEAIRQGKSIPTELRDEEQQLRKAIEMDDEGTEKEQLKTHVDDEYARAGEIDPKVCITTARDPSSRLKQFTKEMRLVFPNSQRINRGNYKVPELVDACRRNDFSDLIVFHETRGEPDCMIITHFPYGPTAYFSLSNCVLRHDIEDRGTISEVYPHLVFHNFETSLGQRISNVLKYLFPVPKPETSRIITFANQANYVSFRHHTYKKENKADVELTECGPRFEMQLFQLKLGTMDQTEAENEWVLRPYMNTAKKRKVL